jgi:hypothetical protein
MGSHRSSEADVPGGGDGTVCDEGFGRRRVLLPPCGQKMILENQLFSPTQQC